MWLINVLLSNNLKNFRKTQNQHETCTHAHTHTPNHQTQCIECSVAMLSTPIDTHRRTMLYTNTTFAPDKCIQCYGNTRCEQKQLQLTICFSFGWRECMFYPCLVQTIMFGNMSTHVDTNRQNSPKSIKRQVNTETMINDKFGKIINFIFPENYLHVWKQIHSLIIC